MKTLIRLDALTTELLRAVTNEKPSKRKVIQIAKKFDKRLRATLANRKAS